MERPGEIFGAGGDPFGAAIAPSGKLVVKNLDLHDNRRGIVRIYDFALKLENVTIRDNAVEGIRAFGESPLVGGPGRGQLTGRNVTITGNGGVGVVLDGVLKLRDLLHRQLGADADTVAGDQLHRRGNVPPRLERADVPLIPDRRGGEHHRTRDRMPVWHRIPQRRRIGNGSSRRSDTCSSWCWAPS